MNKNVLLFKALSEESTENDPYEKILAELNISTLVIPTLEFKYKTQDNFIECINKPEHYSGLIITSPRCARFTIESFKNTKVNLLHQWKQLACFAVGETSARLMLNNLDITCKGSSSGNISNLMKFLSKYTFEKPLLMPCGNLQKDSTSDVDKYIPIQKIEVYETIEHSKLKVNIQKILEKKEDLYFAVFFSPSGVKYVFQYFHKSIKNNIKFIAIGPSTAEELKNNSIKIFTVCAEPTPEGLHQVIKQMLKNDVVAN